MLALQNLYSQAIGCVKSNVAVHKPWARIIGPESNDDESTEWNQNNISPRRIVQRQIQTLGSKLAFGLLEDSEIMTVQMDLGQKKIVSMLNP